MHICYLCSEYPPAPHGGIGSFVKTLGTKLVERGHSVSVIGIYPEQYAGVEQDHGVNVIRVPMNNMRLFRVPVNAFKLRSAIHQLHSENPIDIVETNELGLAFLPRTTFWIKLIRLQGGHHYYSVTLRRKPRFGKSFQEKMSFRKADAVCSASMILAETTRKLLNLGTLPIEVIPNPVDTIKFSPRDENYEQGGLIIFVGTLVEKKGVVHLVDAMSRICQAVPNAELWIIGRDKPISRTGQSMTAFLQERISDEMHKHIKFLGIIPNNDLPKLLSHAQVVTLPSDMEAFGIVFVEAMAMAKPVVAGNNGAGPEVVIHEESGLLCDPRDSESIAQQVIRLLKDQDLRKRLGYAARKRAVEKFSLDILVEKNELYYQRLVQERRHK